MKILYTLIMAAAVISSMNYATQSIFLGSIQFPSKIENPAPFPLLYKGNKYSLLISKDSKVSKKGIFEIYEDHTCNQFHLLITEHIKFPESADFELFETESNYKFFKFTRASKSKELITTSSLHDKPLVSIEEIEYWNIEKFKDRDESGTIIARTIPEDTIILLTNPTFICKVESEEWKADDIYIKLPKIYFDEEIAEQMIQEASARMLFAAVDLGCLHTKITKTTKPHAQNCIISVRDPLNCYISNHNRRT